MVKLTSAIVADLKDLLFHNAISAVDPHGVRNVSGVGNNSANPLFGAADQPFIRNVKPNFTDGKTPVPLVDLREASNVIADQNGPQPNHFGTNSFMTSFGQFFDHGLDFIQRNSVGEKVFIPVHQGDQLYNLLPALTPDQTDPNSPNYVPFSQPGDHYLSLTRGAAVPGTGTDAGNPRENTNKTSPFIDQNQTYGSHSAITDALRVHNKNGTLSAYLLDGKDGNLPTLADLAKNLKVGGPSNSYFVDITLTNPADPNNLQGFNVAQVFGNFDNSGQPLLLDFNPATPGGIGAHYVAGDGRVNENIALTPVHTVFHREHNYQVSQIKAYLKSHPKVKMTEEQIFQAAKAIVEAEYQVVVFDEFAQLLSDSIPGPGLFANNANHGFSGYNPNVDASISAEFASAAYRLGHSMINDTVTIDTNGLEPGGKQELSLAQAFLFPTMFKQVGADALINGQTQVDHQAIDTQIVDAVRNQLLGQPLDLAVFNMARGEDTGLPTLNETRRQLYENGSLIEGHGSDFTQTAKGNPLLKPYASWAEFGQNISDDGGASLARFMQVFAPGLDPNDPNDLAKNDGLENIPLWLGGLAERDLTGLGQLGPTFAWIFRDQLDRLQEGDRFYYKHRFGADDPETAGSDIMDQLEDFKFSDIIMRNSGLKHLGANVFLTFDENNRWEGTKKGDFIAFTDDEYRILAGNDGNDIIHDGSGSSTLYGDKGKDLLFGHDGNDALRGGADDDYLDGGNGADELRGEAGNDILWGGEDGDLISGGAGKDRIYGGGDTDELFGNDGDDHMEGGGDSDLVKGGGGNDWVSGGEARDFVYGGDGNDRVYGDDGDDLVHGNDGDDKVYGGDGDDGRGGADANLYGVYGDAGKDFVSGGKGNDYVYGGAGHDRVNGDEDDDHVFGGTGRDIVDGGSGNDYVYGEAENDHVYGGTGNDHVYGGQGNDRVYGGDGDDELDGGVGNDKLFGGTGADVFVFAKGGGRDIIADFSFGVDHVRLEGGLTELDIAAVKYAGAIATITFDTHDVLTVAGVDKFDDLHAIFA